jgi:hypothetical protein
VKYDAVRAGGDFGHEVLLAVDAPIQALAAQHANLDL